jgi:AcrR family transcriptional regulator
MAKKHGPNKENLEATRRLFLDIARREFSTHGYYNASTASIVEVSGMARGSLYYHFGDKKGLFRAVYSQLMSEMQDIVRHGVENAQTPWDSLIQGCLIILDMSTEEKTRRIIIDVHTALTYRERVEILQSTLLAELVFILKKIMEAGYFKGYDLPSLSIMIFGMLSETSRSFELADDVAAARKKLGDTLVRFLEAARD